MHDDLPANDEGLRAKIAELRQEHQDLADSIDALAAMPNADMLQIARLKRKKLVLKDEITRLSEQIIPDIIA
jgi:hypothetical protein